MLAGMLYGIENQLQAPEPATGDSSDHPGEPLPVHWPNALDIFQKSAFIKKYFSTKFQYIFSEAKRQEIDEFNRQVTLQEYDAYL